MIMEPFYDNEMEKIFSVLALILVPVLLIFYFLCA
jgi:hypothetical protein